MITVPEATKKIVERSRFLSEAISKRLINYSSLARYIKPELEEMLIKNVSQGSIIMALKRLEKDFTPKYNNPQNLIKNIPDISIRSNLYLICLPNSEASGLTFMISREAIGRSFYCQSKGIYETMIILSEDLYVKFKPTLESKDLIINIHDVTALTISLPDEAHKSSGVYYFFLKSLAWEGVNVLETISTVHEFTLILDNSDVERALKIIKSIFN